MPKWEDDSKAGRLSKRINFLKRVTKGGKGNILHAMDMVMQEFPAEEQEQLSRIKARLEGYFNRIDYYVDDVSRRYERLKETDPEYKPKHKPRKRKPKQQKGT